MDDQKLKNQSDNVTESRKGNRFKFESPIPGVHIYSDVWPDSLSWFEKIDGDEYWEQNSGPGNKKWIREDYLNDLVGKRSTTCWVWHDQEVQDNLEEVIDSYLWHWDLDPHTRESLRITRYEPNGEFFGMHPDDSFATPRTTSMVYYPNDDYEGGELEFIHFGVKIKPKAGQLFLFPAGYSYEHKIHPVIGGGYRRTMVSFFNQMTSDEIKNRHSKINRDSFYKADLKYILARDFGA
jgi:hypothetical protein